MTKIYVPEHFRTVKGSEIIERIRASGEFFFINFTRDFKHVKDDSARPVFEGREQVFPSPYSLWDGRHVIIRPSEYHLIQNPKHKRYDQFNADTIQEQLTRIIGETPSISVRKASKERGFSATYDWLAERERDGIRYGYIERTQLIVRPPKLLDESK